MNVGRLSNPWRNSSGVKSKSDPNILGGLIVKVGSKLIDTSIRSKLAKLKNNLKEVG